jgi:hypothetical protein
MYLVYRAAATKKTAGQLASGWSLLFVDDLRPK